MAAPRSTIRALRRTPTALSSSSVEELSRAAPTSATSRPASGHVGSTTWSSTSSWPANARRSGLHAARWPSRDRWSRSGWQTQVAQRLRASPQVPQRSAPRAPRRRAGPFATPSDQGRAPCPLRASLRQERDQEVVPTDRRHAQREQRATATERPDHRRGLRQPLGRRRGRQRSPRPSPTPSTRSRISSSVPTSGAQPSAHGSVAAMARALKTPSLPSRSSSRRRSKHASGGTLSTCRASSARTFRRSRSCSNASYATPPQPRAMSTPSARASSPSTATSGVATNAEQGKTARSRNARLELHAVGYAGSGS